MMRLEQLPQQEKLGFAFDIFEKVLNTSIIQTASYQQLIYNLMSLLEKKQIKYAFGAVGMGAFLFGLFKFYQYLMSTEHPPSILSTNYDNISQEEKSALSFISKSKQHTPILVEDPNRDKLIGQKVKTFQHIKDISYKVILSLMKGNSYQGIVNISFWLDFILDTQQFFKVNYNGGGIKYVMVNGKKLELKQVRYIDHIILISKEFMIEKGKNNIEIIFQNLYSFINSGLSTYFTIDDHQKYSLRQQVIYSINGYLQIEKFIPCLNCLNPCKVKLEVIHPDTFQVFSNTSKSLGRLCSVNQYQKYPFLFDLSSSSLNKSFKLNESTISSYSNLGESAVSTYSSVNYFNRKKANTHFYKQKLLSIHHLFVFCSSMVQLQPTSLNSQLESELLIRYFCKANESYKLAKSINKVHNYILDVFRRLSGQGIKDYINKIDILLISDRDTEGYFSPGVILLSEQSFISPTIDIRCYYLIVRALLGLLQLEKGHNLISVKQILDLNQGVYERFEEFRNYLFIKNQKFQNIHKILSEQKKPLLLQYQGQFLKYFAKQLKFLMRSNSQEKIGFELKNLMLSFTIETHQEFWENFLSNFNFLSPLIVQPLLKLALRRLGIPTRLKLLEQLRQCFSKFKYVLNFYSNDEISDQLPKFIRDECYGLQERLTQVKVKQKFKDFITQRYQKYLPIRSNMTQAESMYLQFKQFNQSKNFHHVSVLKTQLRRVVYFGKKFVYPQRLPIQCSIAAWKLLARLKMYPEDQKYYALICQFENLL